MLSIYCMHACTVSAQTYYYDHLGCFCFITMHAISIPITPLLGGGGPISLTCWDKNNWSTDNKARVDHCCKWTRLFVIHACYALDYTVLVNTYYISTPILQLGHSDLISGYKIIMLLVVRTAEISCPRVWRILEMPQLLNGGAESMAIFINLYGAVQLISQCILLIWEFRDMGEVPIATLEDSSLSV